jgi:hypothetical protein
MHYAKEQRSILIFRLHSYSELRMVHDTQDMGNLRIRFLIAEPGGRVV